MFVSWTLLYPSLVMMADCHVTQFLLAGVCWLSLGLFFCFLGLLFFPQQIYSVCLVSMGRIMAKG